MENAGKTHPTGLEGSPGPCVNPQWGPMTGSVQPQDVKPARKRPRFCQHLRGADQNLYPLRRPEPSDPLTSSR